MHIEQLAIERGAKHIIEMPCEYYKFTPEQLEAFAKALQQQSEPVAEVCALSVDGNENFGEVEWCLKDFKPNFGQKLYTQPPNTVPVEQYNKLLDALNKCRGIHSEHVRRGIINEAIAEAEGSMK